MIGKRFVLRRSVALAGVAIAAAVVVPFSQIIAASQVAPVLAPERFTRVSGPSAPAVRRFTVPATVSGPFTLTIDSGEPDPRRPGAHTNAAKAKILLNGAQVVGPGDFAHGSHLEREVSLLPDNVLEVALVGAPGSHLTLSINGVINVSISSISPDNGPIGTPVLITGSGFDPIGSNNIVTFNGAAAHVTGSTTGAIQTIVPPDATTGPITVTTPNGSASSAPFTVTQANQLLISKSPDQAVYSRGQPITITALLVDGNGQPVPNAAVTLESTPAEDSRTGNTFIYHSDGTFTITATGEGGGQPPVSASLTLTVHGAGASITCAAPFDGGMINATPGAMLAVTGSVSSINGISQFTVNGTDAGVAADGTFSAAITSQWGLNTVDLALIDNSGLQARQLCSFIVANRWTAEGQLTANTVMLKLAQSAIDDTVRAGGINSFADILHTVLNSAALRDSLHNTLQAANPLKPQSCDQSISVFGSQICVVSSEVLYTSSQLPGPNTMSLTLVNGGLAARVRVEDVRVTLRVRGESSGVPYDTTGHVVFDFVEIDTTFDTGIDAAGRPNVSVRANSVAVRVGVVTQNFSGVDAFISGDVLTPLVQGPLRNIVASLLRDFVVNNFNNVLDGLFSGLDVITLPASFSAPRLNGTGSLPLSFALGFSSQNTNSTRSLFGIGTRFTAGSAHARPSLGTAARTPFDELVDPDTGGRAATEAFHDSLRGNALHAMWRAGYFDAILTAGALNGAVPAGAAFVTTASLPPVTRIRSDARTEIALGAMQISLEYPDLFANTLQGKLAGRVSCASLLTGDTITLGGCTVDEFHFLADRPLDAATTSQVEAAVANVLGAMLATAAQHALPALPVPAFRLPVSLAQFGLPAAGNLAVVAPALNVTAPHYLLRGNLGIR